jgi:hypothetical protein
MQWQLETPGGERRVPASVLEATSKRPQDGPAARAWKNVAQCLEKRPPLGGRVEHAHQRVPRAGGGGSVQSLRLQGCRGVETALHAARAGANFLPMGVRSGAPQAIDWA